MGLLEDFNTQLADGTLTFTTLCNMLNCARSGDEKNVMLLSYFISTYSGSQAVKDIDGNVVAGTVMQVDTGDQASAPTAKYTMIRIIPDTSVEYRGETHTAPFNLNADEGRFYPALSGADAVTGNYDWIGWY